MLVTQRQFESTVSAATSRVLDPRDGFHGPSSMSWKIGREAITFLGGGRAALLQLAHPYVAHGVDQHSETRTDPIGRFNRTFLHVFNMIFGSQADALESAHGVRAIHDTIHGPITENIGRFEAGHRYRAHDHDALMWVHATLIHTAVLVFDQVVEPLSWAERDQYYQESKSFAALFGIDAALMPATWTEFDAYVNDMVESDTIRVGVAANDLAKYLLTSPNRAAQPFFDWYNVEHRHAGLALLTPHDVHHGLGGERIVKSAAVLSSAFALHPERFVRRPPSPTAPPSAAWINRPEIPPPSTASIH